MNFISVLTLSRAHSFAFFSNPRSIVHNDTVDIKHEYLKASSNNTVYVCLYVCMYVLRLDLKVSQGKGLKESYILRLVAIS